MKGGEIPYQYQGKTNLKVSDFEEFLENNKDRIFDDFNDLRVKAEGKNPEAKIKVSLLKEEHGSSRVVKGIRGALRHSVMRILHEKGIAYCSPTRKEAFTGSGEFRFYVEFSDLPEWLLGLLLDGILNIRTLGGGVNSGYGRIDINEVAFEQVSIERKLGSENNGSIKIVEEERTENLNHKLLECGDAWKNYNN